MTATPYERALAAIDSVSWRGIKPGLERTQSLLSVLGDPHAGLRGVLVAGTNGKGSVCALVDAVLRAAGHSTALLTKPHLTSYCERIVCDGTQISEDDFGAVMDDVTSAAATLPPDLQPTGFEMLTVAGILVAARPPRPLLVCEVGMGGRLDSTNVLDLGVAALTNVGLDHMEHLGNTVEAIAREKAAIIKPGNIAVTAARPPALEVIRERCLQTDATLVQAGAEASSAGPAGTEALVRFGGEQVLARTHLLGAFQAENLAVAAAVCDALRERGARIDVAALLEGFAAARWRGRMQWLPGSPPVLVDAAHNPAGMAAMVDSVLALFPGRSVAAVVAAMRDKDVRGMIRELQRIVGVLPVAVAPQVQRAIPAAELAAGFGPGTPAAATVPEALALARELAGPDGLVLACGSLYLAGEVLTELAA